MLQQIYLGAAGGMIVGLVIGGLVAVAILAWPLPAVAL